MNFKLNGLVTAMVVAVGMTAFVGTAPAQGVPAEPSGTFFAIDGVDAFDADGNNVSSNTETQVDRGTVGNTMVGTRFSSENTCGTEFPNGFLNFWEERTWRLEEEDGTVLTTLGFTGIVFEPDPATPQEDTDPAIVTTLTGLDAGAYEVNFIFAGALRTPDAPRLQYLHGFSPTDTSQIATSTADNQLDGVELTELPFGTLQVFSSLIGTTTVGADGELSVYIDLDPNANPGAPNASAYLGLSIVPIDVLLGDVNDDGMVTFGDLAPLFDLIFDPDAPFNAVNADVNEDGMITFADIAPLFDIIFGVTSMSDSNGETVDLASNADLDRENNSSVPTGHASVGLAALAMGAVGLRRRRKAA